MAKAVHEIMNRELFSVGPKERADQILGYLLSLRITAAPVIDAERKPLGVVSLRDLIGTPPSATAAKQMTSPAVIVEHDSSIQEAAQLMADGNLHHVVVV